MSLDELKLINITCLNFFWTEITCLCRNKNTILFCLAPFCEMTLSATKDSLTILTFIYKWFQNVNKVYKLNLTHII